MSLFICSFCGTIELWTDEAERGDKGGEEVLSICIGTGQMDNKTVFEMRPVGLMRNNAKKEEYTNDDLSLYGSIL